MGPDDVMARGDPVIRTISFLILLLLVAACGNRVDVETRTDPYGDPETGEPTYSQSATLRTEDALERADRLQREGDFAGAIAVYRDVYRRDASSDDRATALYQWARAEGNLLNPDRDIDAAIARLELLLEQFPDATIAFRAREELTRLRTFQGQAGRPRG